MTDIQQIRIWAAQGVSQRKVAILLDRHPKTISTIATTHKIKFHGRQGPPKTIPPGEERKRKTEACRRWRQRNGAILRVFKVKRNYDPITRFDDLRVMV